MASYTSLVSDDKALQEILGTIVIQCFSLIDLVQIQKALSIKYVRDDATVDLIDYRTVGMWFHLIERQIICYVIATQLKELIIRFYNQDTGLENEQHSRVLASFPAQSISITNK